MRSNFIAVAGCHRAINLMCIVGAVRFKSKRKSYLFGRLRIGVLFCRLQLYDLGNPRPVRLRHCSIRGGILPVCCQDCTRFASPTLSKGGVESRYTGHPNGSCDLGPERPCAALHERASRGRLLGKRDHRRRADQRDVGRVGYRPSARALLAGIAGLCFDMTRQGSRVQIA